MSMMFNNVIIVGITGVGKTTIGKYLAEKLNKQFIDLDKYIEISCGVDIPTIFELEGEDGFRSRETLALSQVIQSCDDYVLSLGGGCVIRSENRQMIVSSNSLTVQLIADLDVIVDRLIKSPNKRPLLANQNVRSRVEELYNSRKELYNMVSDVTINTNRIKPAKVIEKIEKLLVDRILTIPNE